MSNNRFVDDNVSIRIGKVILKPHEIDEKNLIDKVEEFNLEKSVEDIPDWINPEILDVVKVKSWFNMITSMNTDQFQNFKDRTIYLNHAAYHLTNTSPTLPDSYGNEVKFDFSKDQTSLSRPMVDFGNGLAFNNELFIKSKEYLYQVMKEVNDLEVKLKSKDLIENSKEHAELLDQLLIKKYARFCAIKAVKSNLDVLDSIQDKQVIELQKEEVHAMYKDFIVPPMN